MKLNKILTNNKLLIRLIMTYVITSILLTSILMGVVSNYVSNITKDNTTQVAQDLMRQSYNTAYYSLTNIYGDFYQLWSKETKIKESLNSNGISNEDAINISNIIDTVAFREDLIDSVYLINKKSNMVISNVNDPQLVADFYDQGALDLFQDFERYYDSYKNEIFFPRKATFNIRDDRFEKNYISIVYATKDIEGKLNSGIIVNIDQEKLSSLVNTGNDIDTLIIANRVGNIISDSQGVSFAKGLPRNVIINIANSLNDEGNLEGDFGGQESFITYKKADNIGFVFLSITPKALLMNKVYKINKVIAIFFIAAMSISLLISTMSLKKIYEPLNKLIKKMKESSIVSELEMDEYTYIEKTFDNLILKNKHSHIFRIFNGNHSELSKEILGFSKEKFLSIAIIPDDTEHRTTEVLEKLVEIIDKNTNYLGTIAYSDSVSCILNEDNIDDDKIEEIKKKLENLQEIILTDQEISVSIGLGTIVNSLDSIKFSHRYTMIAVQYALSIGHSQIAVYKEIENNKVVASQNKDTITDNIEEYVLNNFSRQDFSVDEVALEVNLSLGYIRQIFKNEKGVTLNDYIINCRIEKAKELLETTDDTAKDISEAVGYYDNRYFYTLFKKKVGVTTDEYRKSRKELSL